MKEKILKLRKQGLTYNQIKDQLGCAKSTISYYCRSGTLPKAESRICRNCKKEFSNIEIINGEKKQLHRRHYCLECSPYGEHNNVQLEKIIHDGKFGCSDCLERKEADDFYYYKNSYKEGNKK